MATSGNPTVRTLDGLHLAATLVQPTEPSTRAVVLVHGGGVTREECGFFTRLAVGLAEAGVASLRFDLRGHGESEGFTCSGSAIRRPVPAGRNRRCATRVRNP
jgi:alpha-beta hydrolase superfamily lysophospholipase